MTKAWTYQGDNIASVESTTSPTLHSVYSGSGLGGVVERHDVNTAGVGSTTSRFYLYNHRGDVVGVSDTSGNLTSAYDYDAYGAVSQSVQSGGGSAPTDDILFTGKDLDPDTGLYYFNARWYDSESGRFVSRTRLRPDVEKPFVFCSCNPANRVDKNGRQDGGITPAGPVGPSGPSSPASGRTPKTGEPGGPDQEPPVPDDLPDLDEYHPTKDTSPSDQRVNPVCPVTPQEGLGQHVDIYARVIVDFVVVDFMVVNRWFWGGLYDITAQLHPRGFATSAGAGAVAAAGGSALVVVSP